MASIFKETGLQIACELLEHHTIESQKCKSKAEGIRTAMENCAKTAHPTNRDLLTELAVQYATEAQEQAKKVALNLKE